MGKITDLLYGFAIAIAAAFIGSYLFITLFAHLDFMDGIKMMKLKGQLGKIITLGAILNLIAFFLLLRFKKEDMARGVLIGTGALAIFTIFV